MDKNLDKNLSDINESESKNSQKPKSINDIKVKNLGKLNFDGMPITQMSAGLNHILFLSKSGVVFAMGDDTNGQCGQGRKSNDCTVKSIKNSFLDTPQQVQRLPAITQVSAGVTHSLFLTAEGIVFGCGMNNH